MKIMKDDRKHGSVTISVSSLDDLWFLSQVIDISDHVSGKTLRKMKLGSPDERKANVVKRWVKITVLVDKIEFHKYNNSLRVSGKITEGPDDVQLGSFHTITIEENSVITITKKKWLKHQFDRLKEASVEKFPKVLLCVLDRKEVSFALLKRYGYEIMSELEGEVQEKRFPLVKKSSSFYVDIVKRLQEYVDRLDIEHVIVASPAFWKDELLKVICKSAPELKNKITLATCNAQGKNALNEVLKRDEVKKVLKSARIIQEIALVDELFEEIGRDGCATYGVKEVAEVASAGAVKVLLITDDLIHSLRQENKFEAVEKILQVVDSTQGEIHIIAVDHEAGQRLQGLGGIAAITRYKKYE